MKSLGLQHRINGRGFTLIEVLVVITIVSLLLAMLLPALAESRAAALRAVCAGRMRHLGVATIAYSTDFKGDFPATGAWGQVAAGTLAGPYPQPTYITTAQSTVSMGAYSSYLSHNVRGLACPASSGMSPYTGQMCYSWETYFAKSVSGSISGGAFNATGWMAAGPPTGGGKYLGYLKFAGSYDMYWEPTWQPSDNPRYGRIAGNFRSLGYMTQLQIDRASSNRYVNATNFNYTVLTGATRAFPPNEIVLWSDRNTQIWPRGWAFIAHPNKRTPVQMFQVDNNGYNDFLTGMNELMADGSCRWYERKLLYVRGAPQGRPAAFVQTWGNR